MKSDICYVCGTKLEKKCLETDIGPDGKISKEHIRVCSKKCSEEYEQNLPFKGKPMQHWSRITGYYQNVAGWNDGKLQELKDRKRYSV